jgi:hypothetical protein
MEDYHIFSLKDHNNCNVRLHINFIKKSDGKCEVIAFDSNYSYFYAEELLKDYEYYINLMKDKKLKPIYFQPDPDDDYLEIYLDCNEINICIPCFIDNEIPLLSVQNLKVNQFCSVDFHQNHLNLIEKKINELKEEQTSMENTKSKYIRLMSDMEISNDT